jgi:hypothetical protein
VKRQVHTGSHRHDVEGALDWWLDISYAIGRYDGDDDYEFEVRIGDVVLHTAASIHPMAREDLGALYDRIVQDISDNYSSEIDQRDIEHLEEA